MEAAVSTEETSQEKAQPAGMAWIGGKQKPFYSPRIIKKGKRKGRIEVRYLRSYNFYKTLVISRGDITRLFPPYDLYLGEQKDVISDGSNHSKES